MAKHDSLKEKLIPPPGQELEFYQQLSKAEWRACKDFWTQAVIGFMPNGKAMSRDTYRYLFDVSQHVGNGTWDSDFPRGRYQFASKRTAARLGLGGRSDKSQTSIISEARREAKRYGFIKESRRGSGGNGYPNKGSVLVMAFGFRNHVDDEPLPENRVEGIPEKSVDPLPGKSVEGIPGKSVPYKATRGDTGDQLQGTCVSDSTKTPSFIGDDWLAGDDSLEDLSPEELQLLGMW